MGVFIAGVLVTLVVAVALVLLFYAAVLDGRDGSAAAERRDVADAAGPLSVLRSPGGPPDLVQARTTRRLTSA